MDATFAGGANPRAEISKLIRDIEAAGGGTLTIYGEHVVDGSINERVTNLTIDFGDTGKLVLGEGLAEAVLKLQPTKPYTGTLRLLKPRIDCSRGALIGGAGSSTAIYPALYARLEIEDCDLYGGGWANDARRGDTGIAPLGIVSGHIKSGRIEGFPDLGIYVTGNYTSPTQPLVPHDEHMLIEGVMFKDCRNGIDSKRRYKRVTARDVQVTDCGVAYRMSWVGNVHGDIDGPDTGPGARMDIIGGTIKKTRVAFAPEGPAVMTVDGTKLVAVKTLSQNQGGTLTGKCVAKKCVPKTDDSDLTADNGTTYTPVTKLKIA